MVDGPLPLRPPTSRRRISVEVIDLGRSAHLDRETVLDSVRKTGSA
jgi:pyruvate/2-oxoglutarate/acetoin dehydrogenase E1 component